MIPDHAGVYAWILPTIIRFGNSNSLTEKIKRYKKIQSYDSKIGNHSKLVKPFPFNWEPLDVTVSKNTDSYNVDKNYQDTLDNLSDQDQKLFQKSIMLGSLFSRPLYIGYTNSYLRRYSEHINGYGEKSNFHKRFYSYLDELKQNESTGNKNNNDLKIKIEDLLFVCINNKRRDVSEQELRLTEEVLKTLANPVFSKI